jgi:hypothetical protein
LSLAFMLFGGRGGVRLPTIGLAHAQSTIKDGVEK